MNGKGDRNRPRSVDYKTWQKNYDNIFKKNQDTNIKAKEKKSKK